MQSGHYDVEYGTVRYRQDLCIVLVLVPVPVPVPMHVELFWHRFPSQGSSSSYTTYKTVAVFCRFLHVLFVDFELKMLMLNVYLFS